MKKSEFFYHLPDDLIAQHPAEPRDSSRLMVYNRKLDVTEHKHFCDVLDYLQKGDVLVVNNTRVIPARIYGQKDETGAKIEFLLHKRINLTDWEVLAKPARKAKIGTVFLFGENLKATILEWRDDGARIVRFDFEGVFEDILNRIGEMPLPHYIHEKLDNQERYQTVYSQVKGSAAAPTAGLHFTPELMQKIREKGVEIVEVLLHVGLGTFRPVKTDEITDHKMHSEFFCIMPEVAEKINAALKESRRVIAVGTTSVRVLESAANFAGFVEAKSGFTNIFIYPPYRFKVVKALITNFHLPESTLIMLVSAFCTREKVLELYNCAVENRYRFFSFGDAMLLL